MRPGPPAVALQLRVRFSFMLVQGLAGRRAGSRATTGSDQSIIVCADPALRAQHFWIVIYVNKTGFGMTRSFPWEHLGSAFR